MHMVAWDAARTLAGASPANPAFTHGPIASLRVIVFLAYFTSAICTKEEGTLLTPSGPRFEEVARRSMSCHALSAARATEAAAEVCSDMSC